VDGWELAEGNDNEKTTTPIGQPTINPTCRSALFL
jgi:hypothetical protein